MCLSSWKSGTTEKEYIHTSGTKHPNNMGKSIIQNALNYLSSFLLQVQEENVALQPRNLSSTCKESSES
jgi:hypothetical protein